MLRRVVDFLLRDDGPTAVEYAVMISLILGAVLGAVSLVGTNTSQLCANNNTKLKAVGFGS